MIKYLLDTVKNIFIIIGNILDYIYDFLFDWEDDPYEEKDFIENEKVKHSAVKEEHPAIDKQIEIAFGKKAANFVRETQKEVDFLIKEHNLVKENTIRVVLPPQKIDSANKAQIFEETIERVYNQYDEDVILKPGKINILSTDAGTVFAEMEIESYAVSNELLEAV